MSPETPQFNSQFKTDAVAQRLNNGMKLTDQQLDADGYGTKLQDGYSTTDSLQELQGRLQSSLQQVQNSSLSPKAKEDILLGLAKTLEQLKQAAQKYEQLRGNIRDELQGNLDSLFTSVQALQKEGKEHFGNLEKIPFQDSSYTSKDPKEFSAWLSDKNKNIELDYVHSSDIYSEFQIFRTLSRQDPQSQKGTLERVLGHPFEPKSPQEAQELRSEFHRKLHLRIKVVGSIGAVLEGKEKDYVNALLEVKKDRETQAGKIVDEVKKSGVLEKIATAVSKKLGLSDVTPKTLGDGLVLSLTESNTHFEYHPDFIQKYAEELIGNLKKIALAPAGEFIKSTLDGVLGFQLKLPLSVTKTKAIGDSNDSHIFYGYNNFVPLIGAKTLLASKDSNPNIAAIQKIDSNCSVAPSIQFTPGSINVSMDVEFKNISKNIQEQSKKFNNFLSELIDVSSGSLREPTSEQLNRLSQGEAGDTSSPRELYTSLKSYFDSIDNLDAPAKSHLAQRLQRSVAHEYMMQMAKTHEGWNFTGVGVGVIKAVGAVIPYVSLRGQNVSLITEHRSAADQEMHNAANKRLGLENDSLRNQGVRVERKSIGITG